MNRTKTVKPKIVELSSEDKAKQRKKLMAEFLAKGGKIEKVPAYRTKPNVSDKQPIEDGQGQSSDAPKPKEWKVLERVHPDLIGPTSESVDHQHGAMITRDKGSDR